jgi:hypothetical protein
MQFALSAGRRKAFTKKRENPLGAAALLPSGFWANFRWLKMAKWLASSLFFFFAFGSPL